jgi:hypothetical protein
LRKPLQNPPSSTVVNPEFFFPRSPGGFTRIFKPFITAPSAAFYRASPCKFLDLRQLRHFDSVSHAF